MTFACLYGCIFIEIYSYALIYFWGWLVYMTGWHYGYKTCNKHHNTVRRAKEVSTTTRHHGVSWAEFTPGILGKGSRVTGANQEYLHHNGIRTRNIWILIVLLFEFGYLRSSQLNFWTRSVPKLNGEIVILQLRWRVLVWITMHCRVENFIQIIVCTIANS